MMLKERLATDYILYRYPNLYIIALVPMIPSLVVILIRSNLYDITDGVFGTVRVISKSLILDYFFYFRLITSVVTAFFLVYRWSQIRKDGGYGFWITQGVTREKFVFYVIVSYALLIASSEITGVIMLIIHLQLQISILHFLAIFFGVYLSNILLSTIAITIAEFVNRPEIAGMFFVSLSVLNTVVNNNEESILYRLLLLEYNFDSDVFFVTLLLELVLIGGLGAILLYVQRIKDISL